MQSKNIYLLQMCSHRLLVKKKTFGGIANGIWTNYSGVCAPLRHNLASVQTYCSTARHVESKWAARLFWVKGKEGEGFCFINQRNACAFKCTIDMTNICTHYYLVLNNSGTSEAAISLNWQLSTMIHPQ